MAERQRRIQVGMNTTWEGGREGGREGEKEGGREEGRKKEREG